MDWTDDSGNRVQLLRCPFCGKDVTTMISQTDLFGFGEDLADRFTVVCDMDKGGCGASCGFTWSKTRAANKWNSRAKVVI